MSLTRTAIAVIVATLCVAAPVLAQKSKHGEPPSARALQAGSQIPWVTSLDDAMKLAKEKNRPIFWYVPTVTGSTMDRKPVIDMYMMAGPFSMPDFANLIARRTIPLKCVARRAKKTTGGAAPAGKAASKDDGEPYDLVPLKFIEPGFALIAPDGKLIFRIDQLTCFHELWLTELVDRALSGAGVLGRPSDATAAAKDPLDVIENHLLDGAWGRAQSALAGLPAGTDAVRAGFLRGCVLARAGEAAEARTALSAVPSPEARVELGLLALRDENWQLAADTLVTVTDGTRVNEARWLEGVARDRLGRKAEARALWTTLAAGDAAQPFVAKAAAEVERFGPFSRGFEEYGRLPKDALEATPVGTRRARQEKDAGWVAERSVKYLLECQGDDGGYTDSNYDFGGLDSVPDVYVACTAINARALLEWREVAPERVDAAVRKAVAYCSDESHCATSNEQERMWAHAYRLLFFARWLELNPAEAPKIKEKMQQVVKLCEGLQKEKGIWAHEYPNPFVSATVLHALHVAQKAGAVVNAGALKSGTAAMQTTRGKDANFSYGFPGKGERDPVFAAGRNAMCELALLLGGAATQESVTTAVKAGIANQPAYEAVRKYDDHSPPHRIGGFFFWWDMLGRTLATEALQSGARADLHAAQRKIILSIPEIDGRFIDSHELGKPYGTAMALICLKLTAPPKS